MSDLDVLRRVLNIENDFISFKEDIRCIKESIVFLEANLIDVKKINHINTYIQPLLSASKDILNSHHSLKSLYNDVESICIDVRNIIDFIQLPSNVESSIGKLTRDLEDFQEKLSSVEKIKRILFFKDGD